MCFRSSSTTRCQRPGSHPFLGAVRAPVYTQFGRQDRPAWYSIDIFTPRLVLDEEPRIVYILDVHPNSDMPLASGRETGSQ